MPILSRRFPRSPDVPSHMPASSALALVQSGFPGACDVSIQTVNRLATASRRQDR
jgi:hypothetical protein